MQKLLTTLQAKTRNSLLNNSEERQKQQSLKNQRLPEKSSCAFSLKFLEIQTELQVQKLNRFPKSFHNKTFSTTERRSSEKGEVSRRKSL
jgi:hypothetical protein